MNIGGWISALWGVLGALLPLLVGVGAAEWWEHRPAGEPAWAHVDVLFLHLRPPDGLAAQRDRARAALAAAQAGEARLERGLAAQNAAVRDQAAAGARAIALAQAELDRARRDAASTAARLAVIGAPITGASECDRVRQVDVRLLESLP